MSELGPSLSDLVQRYMATYRNPDLPPFGIHKFGMEDWWQTPESAKCGCYIVYSETGQALYVGKASLGATIGSRLAAHDRRNPRAQWREEAAYIQFVTVTEAFEAPSLEEFLIQRLHPVGNKLRGKLTAAPSNVDTTEASIP